MNTDDTQNRDSYLAIFAVCFLLTLSYYMIEHVWDASDYVMFSSDYTGDENRTGDKMSSVSGSSSAFRLFLAGFGVMALIFPNRHRLRLANPLMWAWGTYWAWLFASVLWSANPPNTIFKLAVLTVFGTAAWGISRWFSQDGWNLVLAVSCAMFIVVGMLAELQLGNFRPWMSEYRLSGTQHPNSFAIYGIVMVFVASIYVGRQVRTTAFWVLFGLAGLMCLLMTKSRTALLSLIVGLSAIQLLRLPPAKRFTFAVGFGGFAALMGLGLALVSTAAMRGTLGNLASMGRGEEVSTLTGRVPLWEELIDHIQDRPLVGYGYLGFWDADRVEELADIFKWEIPHGHNMYLDIILDGGVLGLGLYLLFLVTGLVVAWRTYSTNNAGAAFAFGLVAAVLVHGFAESLFKMPGFAGFILYSSLFRLLWVEKSPAEPKPDIPVSSEEAFEPVAAPS